MHRYNVIGELAATERMKKERVPSSTETVNTAPTFQQEGDLNVKCKIQKLSR